MRRRLALSAVFALLLALGLTAQRDAVEVFEIASWNFDQRPAGKEADGIVGDYVLRNEHVEILIGGNLPLRRPNMTTDYSTPLPGTLYDLDVRGAKNDQLTVFRPGGERGMMSWVRPLDDGSGVEAVRTGPRGEGLAVRHEYRLGPDAPYVRVVSTYRNEGMQAKKITPRPVWKGLDQEAQAGEIRTGDSIDPFDKRGYAWAPLEPATLPEEVELAPGQEAAYTVALAVGDSPLAAYGVLAALLGKTGEVEGSVTDASGNPAVHGAVIATIAGTELKGYPDTQGGYSFRLPEGAHGLRFEDIGREAASQTATVRDGRTTQLDWSVSDASQVSGLIRDESGNPSPAKIQFIGRNGTETPNLGTYYRVHGNDHQYQTHDGRFSQQVPPGDYLLRITHGPEFDLVEKTISVEPGERVAVEAVLKRTVDTAGWISTDFHAHSTPSGDNYCNTTDRLINFAAEHIEYAPTTEHNRIYDWAPELKRLGLDGVISTVPGIELTGSGQHFNAFPMTPDPHAQNGGAPVWHYDPRINAITLRSWNTPTLAEWGTRFDSGANARVAKDRIFGSDIDRWVQANHPSVEQVFFDRDGDGVRDGGFVGFEQLIDAAEVWSASILEASPVMPWRGSGRPNRTFFWLQMLNQGRRVWCVAVSDAHRIFGNGVGDWRTYVPSSTDDPAEIDSTEIIRNAKAGRMMISNGPFLEVETADGLPIGSTVHAEGYVDLKIRVQAANWVEVNRVQVLVNGRQPAEYNFTAAGDFHDGVLRFEKTVRVRLQEDAHLIVAAVGEGADLSKGWGRSIQGQMIPAAYTNPIFVDVDRDGFEANGDTLGHDLPSVSDDD